MIYLLIIVLITMLVYSIKTEKNIYNPLTIFSSIWLIISIFNSFKLYGLYPTSNKAFILLILGMLSFTIGFYLSKYKLKKKTEPKKKQEKNITINWYIVRILIFIGIILTGLLSIKVLTLLFTGTPYSSIRGMYYSYGDSIPLIPNNTLFTLYDWTTSSLIYALTIVNVVGIFYCKEKDKKSIIGMIIFYILYIFSCSGRTTLINLLLSLAILTIINYKNINKKHKKNIIITFAVITFIIFGITTIRTINQSNDSINNAYSYFSISMPMFSFWVDYIDTNNWITYGYATIYGIYLIIQKLVKVIFGYKFPNAELLFQMMNKPQSAWIPMFESTSERFNAYTTMFYNFYLDFRIPGIIILTMLYSFVISKIYQKVIKKEKNMILTYIYIILLLGLINSFIRWPFSGVTAIAALILPVVLFKEEKQNNNQGKKVLVFGITDNPGGVESVIMNYYKNINKKIVQFDFLCNTEKVVYSDEIKELGGEIHIITARSKNIIKYYKELNDFYKKNAHKYKAIWVNVCSLANIDYLIFAKIYNIPIRIIHSHNSQNMDSKLRGIVHKINKLYISKIATDFWSCSNQASNWFYSKKIINSEKYMMINNAIDLERFKYSEDKRKLYREKLKLNKKIVYANIGRLHFQKNQIFLLDIFYEIKKTQQNAVLLIIGQGEEEENLKQKIKELGIEDSVNLMGVRNDIPDLLNAIDYMIFPSLFEGLSLTLLESQASGLPTFVSNTCDKQTNMSPEYHVIDLEESAEEWARKITTTKIKYERNNIVFSKSIREKGFDIKTESKKLERFLGD